MNDEPRPRPESGGDKLRIWTIYDHPSDHPDMYVARPHDVIGGGVVEIGEGIGSTDLEYIRRHMRSMGLTCLARHPDDDPVIVETWL